MGSKPRLSFKASCQAASLFLQGTECQLVCAGPALESQGEYGTALTKEREPSVSFPLWFLCFSSSLLQLMGFFPPSQWHSGCIEVSKPWCGADIKKRSPRRKWWVAFQLAHSGYTELVLSQNFVKEAFGKARRKKEPSCVVGFQHWGLRVCCKTFCLTQLFQAYVFLPLVLSSLLIFIVWRVEGLVTAKPFEWFLIFKRAQLEWENVLESTQFTVEWIIVETTKCRCEFAKDAGEHDLGRCWSNQGFSEQCTKK